MNTELEVKFYPVDKAEIRARLAAIGAKLEHQERIMYRTSFAKEENKEMAVDYIRVRDEGDLIRLSAKVHATKGGNISDQKELDVKVSSYEDCIKILELAGLKISKRQETKRETWIYKNSEIVIDTWPGLETYIEIESVSESEIKEIAELLDFDWNDRRITSVVEIYQEVLGESKNEVLARVKDLKF